MNENMCFAENLQFLRKQKNITQEQLAEQLEVSRQSVSKWESGASYPEMDKLMQICSMFHCGMDTLMRGDVRREFATDVYGYDKFYNQFGRMIALGVGLILFGIGVMCLLTGLGFMEDLAAAVMFVFIIAAVMIFVVMGLQNSRFTGKYPVIEDFYTEEEKDAAYRKFILRIAVGVGGILLAVLFMITADGMLTAQAEAAGWLGKADRELQDELVTGVFMVILAVVIPVLVYGGLQKSKYDIASHNHDNNPTPAQKKRRELIGRLCGIIMLVAVIVHLVLMFGPMQNGGSFRGTYVWLVYAVGGILCGIVSIALSHVQEDGEPKAGDSKETAVKADEE